jgi:AraC-like DNA-binding protein
MRLSRAVRSGTVAGAVLRSPPARAHGGTELFRSSLLAIVDWRCPGHDTSGEELSREYQVIVARRGAFVRTTEGRSTFADAASACFWNPAESYRVRHPVAGGDDCSVFTLPAEGALELLREYHPRSLDATMPRFPTPRAPLDGPSYLAHRLAMHASSATGTLPMLVEELGIEFLHRAVAAACAPLGREDRRRREARNRSAATYAARVREVIAARYRQPLSLAELSRAVHCSPYHLSRIVTAVEGVPIHRLLLRLRLRDALERLLDSDDAIATIALECGFASHSHFTDAFRREFGVTPRAVRRLSAASLRSLTSRIAGASP